MIDASRNAHAGERPAWLVFCARRRALEPQLHAPPLEVDGRRFRGNGSRGGPRRLRRRCGHRRKFAGVRRQRTAQLIPCRGSCDHSAYQCATLDGAHGGGSRRRWCQCRADPARRARRPTDTLFDVATHAPRQSQRARGARRQRAFDARRARRGHDRPLVICALPTSSRVDIPRARARRPRARARARSRGMRHRASTLRDSTDARAFGTARRAMNFAERAATALGRAGRTTRRGDRRRPRGGAQRRRRG